MTPSLHASLNLCGNVDPISLLLTSSEHLHAVPEHLRPHVAVSACWKQPGNQNNNVVMLHIYILTFILAESKALCTVNTWLGLASCHLGKRGQVSDRCVGSLQGQQGTVGLGMWMPVL